MPAEQPSQPSELVSWLLCKQCLHPLAPIFSDGARTYLFLAPQVEVHDATLTCRCGRRRRFVSVRLPN